MVFNPDIHHRRSIRMAEYDYTEAGGYFMTLCANGRECLFGEVVDENVRLNEFGVIVQDEWLRSAVIRKEITLDEFVIMPNHMHGIVLINEIVCVGADGVRPESGNSEQTTVEPKAYGNEGACHAPLRGPKSLGAFVAGFKSAVTKRINKIRDNSGCPVWQRNYFERVIRSERELSAIREYIVNNPKQWAMDRENPANKNV
jgi:putative transposase